MVTRKTSIGFLLAMTMLAIVAAALTPRIGQPQSYHMFADQRRWLGIPNFGDVVSNVPFALVGIWGLWFLLRLTPEQTRAPFIDARERWPYVLVAGGLLLTAFGSGYYHLAPDNARLVWDRLPMIIVFMSLISAMIAERISVRAGLWLLPVLLVLGAASVVQWYWSELRGAGDLRFYGVVQVYAGLVLVLMLFFPARYTRTSDLGGVVGWYLLAKLWETLYKPIFALGHIVSGHTLKHLAAAMGGWWILRMVRKRAPITVPSTAVTSPNL